MAAVCEMWRVDRGMLRSRTAARDYRIVSLHCDISSIRLTCTARCHLHFAVHSDTLFLPPSARALALATLSTLTSAPPLCL